MSKSELEKWSEISGEIIIEFEEFLDWLQAKKHIWLCNQEQGVEWPWVPRYYPIPRKILDYWMEFNDIDPQQLEKERRDVLKDFQEKHKK
jgi:hypothetical protein